ncbi:hypothetical protein AB1Y20_011327 [Prymnesium parvum]|uniref:Uncharacterized protein n=1 Tax=Prymnesium parvum TaxID=97485 RepID=A0AB34IMK5_PRYPA
MSLVQDSVQDCSPPLPDKRVSLAVRVGPLTAGALSLLLLLCHGLFLFAQLASALQDCPTLPQLPNFTSACDDSNELMLARVDAAVTFEFEAKGLISAAFGFLEASECNSSCPDAPSRSPDSLCSLLACDSCTSLAGVELEQRCRLELTDSLMTISTLGSIYMLWWQDESPTCLSGAEPWCVGTYPYRVAGAAYFFTCLIWPHLKLLLLHLAFYLPLRAATRRNVCFWLALFGKWTLMDCLSMFVILGLYHIRIPIPLATAYGALDHHCLPLCAMLNGTACGRVCDDVSRAAHHLSLPSGEVHASLTMSGQAAMTCYRLAALLSISSSALVEFVDERRRPAAERREALLAPPADPSAPSALPPSLAAAAAHGALLVAQLVAVSLALASPFFERTLSGSAVAALGQLGVRLDATFSLLHIGTLLPLHGSDLPNTLSYVLFVLLCPLLVPLASLAVLLGAAARAPVARLRALLFASRYLSYFAGFEVLLIAVLLIENSQFSGRGTQGLLNEETFPQCSLLAHLFPESEHCFQMDMHLRSGFGFAIGATVLYFLSGMSGSPTYKYLHRRLYVDDPAPPPNCPRLCRKSR